MKVTLKKTGRFAHPIPSQPQADFKEGETVEVDPVMGAELLKVDWAVIPEEKKPEEKAVKKAVKKKIKKGKK